MESKADIFPVAFRFLIRPNWGMEHGYRFLIHGCHSKGRTLDVIA